MPAAAGNLTLMEGIKAGSLAKVGLLTKAMAYVGSSLILYGVAELLTPLPEAPTEETPNSFQFNSPINTSVAGLPVPILYGERMVGSVVISAGIDVINN